MDVRIKFLGAAQSVTGSKYLLEVDDFRILIDCGLFQGLKELRLRNWDHFPVDLDSIDLIVLTHAHLDHSGYLPRLFKQNFARQVYCTNASKDLLELILLDSAKLQEEEALFARKKGYSRHENPEPLYNIDDAKAVLPYIKSFEYDSEINLSDKISLQFKDAGHLLGSSILEFTLKGDHQNKKIVFSGDLGRQNQQILRDPAIIKEADILLVESTYGDRENPANDPKMDLASFINETLKNKGVMVIPAFSVGRTQVLITYLNELFEEGLIPDLPVYIDSPMAINATAFYKKHHKYHKLNDYDSANTRKIFEYKNLHYIRDRRQSQDLNLIKSGAVIISASGMCNGGRILHHLFHRLPNAKNTILFVGYQAEGTRGRRILEGEPTIKIFGEEIPVAAQIRHLDGLSAHADRQELMNWLNHFENSPKMTFVVHGEAKSSHAFAGQIREEKQWNTFVPKYMESFELFKSI